MSIDWKELEITKTQLEDLLNFNIISNWAIDVSRVILLRNKQYYKSLLFTESGSLFLIYVLFFPITLIILRSLDWLSNNTKGFVLVLLSTSFIYISILVIFNYYLWGKAKKLKVFAILLEKVNQYNNLVDNLKIITQLNDISSHSKKLDNSPAEIELKTALQLTKNSLIKSLELEEFLNRDRNSPNNPYQLLANLESGLINLSSFSEDNSDSYQELLSQVIEIGLSVHQEIRKTQTLR